jgi:DNA-binding SARP family transcriptional activator
MSLSWSSAMSGFLSGLSVMASVAQGVAAALRMDCNVSVRHANDLLSRTWTNPWICSERGGSNGEVDKEVRLALADGLTVSLADQVVSPAQVGSRKARTLLALLAVRRGKLVPADLIAEALWGDAPPSRSAENVATLVSRLRTALGPELVLGGRGGYRLGPAVRVDLDEAAELVTEAERRLAGREPALARIAAERARGLLEGTGVLPEEPDALWAEPARADHAQLLRKSRYAAGEAALEARDAGAARVAAEAAARDDPLDEVAWRLLMRAEAAAGEPVRALAAYERLRAALAGELGVDPSQETREVHAAILQDRSGHPAGVVAAEGFAGRESELAGLAGAWHSGLAGRPRLALITGEAGIGKTRLAEQAARAAVAEGGRLARARCYEAERSLFLQPVTEALAQVVGGLPVEDLREVAACHPTALGLLLPDVAAMLPGEVPATPAAEAAERGSAEVERRRIHESVVRLLRRLTARQPLVLLLDDLHHAGIATVELLHYLARHAAPSRLMVLATVRVEEGQQVLDLLDEVADRVEVGPLGTDAIARLAADAGQAELAAEIEARTRGHTLFVVETLRALAWGETGIPDSLRHSVLARVRRAGPGAEELLRAASVLGPSFSPVTVAGLLDLGPQEAARRCERILPTRLTRVCGRVYEIANDLVQEVLYDDTPVPTRQVYHHRAADLLAAGPEVAARHAAAAEDWPRAALCRLTAGRLAMDRYAADDAKELLDLALEAAGRAGDDGLRGRAHLSRGRVHEMMFRYDDALHDHEAAVGLGLATGERRLRMDALRQLGGPAWSGAGRPVAEGAEHLREGLRLAELLGDRAAEAHLLGWLSVIASNRLLLEDALTYGRRALTAAEAAGDERAMAAALDGLKTAHAHLGDVAALGELIDELEPLVRRLGDLWLLQWCVFESALPYAAAGAWDQAVARVEQALAVNRRSGYTGYESWYVAHLGWLERLRGRHDEAIRHGRQSLGLDSHAWWNSAAAAIYATTLIEVGDTAQATTLLERGLESCERHRTQAYRLRCLAPLAEVTGSRALLDDADTMIREIQVGPGAAWLAGCDAYLSVARAWLAHQEPGRAARVLDPLLAAAARAGWQAPAASARSLAERAGLVLPSARTGGKRGATPTSLK